MTRVSRDQELDIKMKDNITAIFKTEIAGVKSGDLLNNFECLSLTKISTNAEFDRKIVNFVFATAFNMFTMWTLHYFYLF